MSHLPTFLFEDVPLFILNVQISAHLRSFPVVSVISLVLSAVGIVKKGWTILQWCSQGVKGDVEGGEEGREGGGGGGSESERSERSERGGDKEGSGGSTEKNV